MSGSFFFFLATVSFSIFVPGRVFVHTQRFVIKRLQCTFVKRYTRVLCIYARSRVCLGAGTSCHSVCTCILGWVVPLGLPIWRQRCTRNIKRTETSRTWKQLAAAQMSPRSLPETESGAASGRWLRPASSLVVQDGPKGKDPTDSGKRYRSI